MCRSSFNWNAMALWLPGVLFGVYTLSYFKPGSAIPLTVPLMLFGAIGLFYVVLAAAGWSMAGARSHGWLPIFPPAGIRAISLSFLSPTWRPGTCWRRNGAFFITILVTSVVSILLTASALELAADEEIDLNRELRAAGLATFAAGLGGGMVGFHSLSMSRLVLSMGGGAAGLARVRRSLRSRRSFSGLRWSLCAAVRLRWIVCFFRPDFSLGMGV